MYLEGPHARCKGSYATHCMYTDSSDVERKGKERKRKKSDCPLSMPETGPFFSGIHVYVFSYLIMDT
jgi:hypothetical protein